MHRPISVHHFHTARPDLAPAEVREAASMASRTVSRGSPYLLSVLRIVAGFLFIFHGTQKLFAFPPGPGGMGPVEIWSRMGAAGLLEFVGGALLILGLFTRPVAFVLAGEMAFAYFMAHAPRAFLPIVNGGELAALYCFLFLYFAAAGAGPWSADAMRRGYSPRL